MPFSPADKEQLLSSALLALGGGLLQGGAPRVGGPAPGFGPGILALQNSLQSGRDNILKRQFLKQELSIKENSVKQREEAAKAKNETTLAAARIRAGKGTGRDAKIDALVAQGMAPSEAINLVDKNIEIKINPVLGTAERLDRINQTVTEIPIGRAKELMKTLAEPDKTEPQKFQVGDAFGVISAGKRALDKTFGTVWPLMRFPDARAADSFAAGIKSDIVRAMAISDRPPVIEQKRIMDAMPSSGFFENEESATAVLNTTVRRLKTQVEDDRAFAKDPSNPPLSRRKSIERAKAIERTVKLMKQFKGVDGKSGIEDAPQSSASPMRAVNPSTGAVLILRNGQWVPE